MRTARQILLALLVAGAGAPTAVTQSSPSEAPEKTSATAADVTRERTLVDESEAARRGSDYATARAKAAEAVTSLLARPESEQDGAWLSLLESAGLSAWKARDARTANSAFLRVHETRVARLSDEHSDLQRARGNLAMTLSTLGDPAGAKLMFEKVLEIRARTLPDDHPDVLTARRNLAVTLSALGDSAGARNIFESVLEVLSRTLPENDPELQTARGNLAAILVDLDDLVGAKALQQQVLEVSLRILPNDHPSLQMARGNLALTLKRLGDLAGARTLQQEVLEVLSRTLPDDHPDLQEARENIANTLSALGDLDGARALYEKVIEIHSERLPDDHIRLQVVRGNLAATLSTQGDLAGARVLFETVLEVLSQSLPNDHPYLQAARGNLAGTLFRMGDFDGARVLLEKLLEILARTVPDDDLQLQWARLNLAAAVFALGDLVGARDLLEKVVDVRSRTLPGDHPAVLAAQGNLAVALKSLGDLAGARAVEKKVLDGRSRTLPDDLPDLQEARKNLTLTIARQFARGGSSEGSEVETEARERCVELIGAMCRSQVRAARAAILASPAREAEERCSRLAQELDVALSLAQGHGVFEPLQDLDHPVFVLSETTRGAALASTALSRAVAPSPKYAELRDALRAASAELVGLAQKGSTGGEFDRACMKRDAVERELGTLARELAGGGGGCVEFDVASLSADLAEREAAVGFRRFTKYQYAISDELDSTGQPAVREVATESLCAFVLRRVESPGTLKVIELGPIVPIEDAVTDWLDRVLGETGRGLTRLAPHMPEKTVDEGGARAAAISLRELVFDPLMPALDGVERLIVVMDDVLHAVPIDALPLTPLESRELVLLGDRYRIEQRRTLLEVLFPDEQPAGEETLLVLGGASFDEPPLQADTEDDDSLASEAPAPAVASLLRGGAWNDGFVPLPNTSPEARQIAARFAEATSDASHVVLLDEQRASRASIEALAPRARWLHLATHGWFAPESIRSWEDPGPLDHHSGLGKRMSAEERIVGSSPMVLCGLALAGANLPADAIGRYPGLVTAEEMSTWDLTNCELAVLSACDTNDGVRRVGQGVASLQKALHMAGARSVITSLWKVPDEATKELMLDFYRRLWVEKKPKHRALWEAKMKLRDARDADGQLAYTTRDWAAWVLTGDPD